MFKARHVFVFFLAAALNVSGAIAGTGGTPAKVVSISWDEFKTRCADPDSFNNQRMPKEIKLQCTNIEREFVADAPGTVDLASLRHVETVVLSDKFNVTSMGREFISSAKPGSCQRYKEVEKTITVERPLTCGEVLGIKGDVTDYCAAALDLAKGTSPKLIDVRDTGNVHNTCGVTASNKK